MNHLVSQEWIDAQMAKHKMRAIDGRLINSKPNGNPCVVVFGPGPTDALCKACIHFRYHQPGNKVFRKCVLRGITSGPGTDHRSNWPACGKYEVRK